MRRLLPLMLVLAVGLGLRLAYVAETRAAFRTPTPGLDIDLHLQAARELGLGPEDGPRFALMMASTPVYPAVLRGLMGVVGDDVTRLRFAQCFLALALPLGLCLALRRLTGSATTGTIAAGLWAVSPALVHFDGHLEKSAIELGALALALALVLGAAPASLGRSALRGLGMGLCLALAAGIQQADTVLALAMLLVVLLAPGTARQRGVTLLVAGALVGLTLLGLSAWRKAAPDGPLARAQRGVHLRVGFHDGASGAYSQLPEVPGFPEGHVFIAHADAETRAGALLTDVQSDAMQTDEALAWIRQHPGAAAGLVLRKLRLAFADFESKGNDYYPALRERSSVLKLLPMGFGVVLVLAALGLMVTWTRPRREGAWSPRRSAVALLLLLGAATLPVVVSFVTWRYRLPMLLPLLLLAALGLGELASRVRRWIARGPLASRRELAVALPVVAAVGLVTFWPAPAPIVERMETVSRNNVDSAAHAEQVLATLPASGPGRTLGLFSLSRHREAWLAAHSHLDTAAPSELVLLLHYDVWLGRAAEARELLARVTPEDLRRFGGMIGPIERRWLDRFAR